MPFSLRSITNVSKVVCGSGTARHRTPMGPLSQGCLSAGLAPVNGGTRSHCVLGADPHNSSRS